MPRGLGHSLKIVRTMDEWVQVEVWLPKRRIPDLYETVSQWTKSAIASGPATDEQELQPLLAEPPARSWDEGSPGLRLRDATRVIALLSPNAQKIVRFLSANPGRRYAASEIADALDLSGSAAFTGTLGSVGARSKTVRRTTPIRYEAGEDGGRYWMEPDTAQLFHRVVEVHDNNRMRIQEYEVRMAALLEQKAHLEAEIERDRDELALEQLARINTEIANLEASIRGTDRSFRNAIVHAERGG